AAAEAPAQAPVATGSGGEAETVRRLWTDVLGALYALKRGTWTLVSDNATVLEHRGGVLRLQFTTAGLATAFSRGNHPAFVAEALLEVTGIEAKVEAVAAGGSGPSGRGPAPAAARGRPSTAEWSSP
ncbi:DNA polymerase III subunit gamma/tau, partial [Kineococcus sp. R8]|nr:DNA polymerase III subunit gamma/tau [Kineococcus siccus]